jgi:hypothetical protein
MRRTTEIHRMDWNGMLMEITYEPDWLPARIAGQDFAYLRVHSIYPTAASLPIAPCGFYAHTLPVSIITAAGGPVNYVDVMLEAETHFQGART